MRTFILFWLGAIPSLTCTEHQTDPFLAPFTFQDMYLEVSKDVAPGNQSW